MDDFKLRAGEKLGALHEAAKTAAGSSKSKVEDAVQQTSDAVRKIREVFHEIWHHELITEGRARVAAWSKDAVQRIKEGAPPLSPVLLYEELVALFKDRVWRRSMVIFTCGALAGGLAGAALALRLRGVAAAGPHTRALWAHGDQAVMLVEDAVAPSAGPGEVLVRVQAFSVGESDRAALRGRGTGLRGLLGRSHSHLVVGRGFAGVVLDVGVGVGDLELGDEVWGCVSEWAGGAAAELLTIRSTRVSKRPRALAADAAAAVPWDGSAALAALERLGLGPDTCKGKRVAVIGAGGGGVSAVQLVAGWGGVVTALVPTRHHERLKQMGVSEFIDQDGFGISWCAVSSHATRRGPWDALLAVNGAPAPRLDYAHSAGLLKATAPRSAALDCRPRPLLSDRLPATLLLPTLLLYRTLRWITGFGTHTDWLEDKYRLRDGLLTLAVLVDKGVLVPVLDKVYLPQDFENALAHACSDDALGATVIRFP